MSLPVLTAATWSEVSALLDEVLALPPEARDGFVEALDGERAAHRDTLRDLLSRAAGVETEDFLATLPRLTRLSPGNERGPLTELAAGESIGPYRLLSELGAGGMGAVWLAERSDGQLKRKVALKLPRLVWAKGLAERMARERDILASLEHPHIARLYDAGVDQHGRPYLALEYVEGQPIDVYARERGLSVRQKLDLLLQVCSTVAFAHSRLVVHRDLKPSNILVTADGQVRLLDFGIAKLMEGDRTRETQLTQLAGRALTLDYASPEQIKGEPIGTASDAYSLGVVAYELLTGAKPYKLKRGSAAELEEAIATADPPKASDTATDAAVKKVLRGDLDAILNKALKKAAAHRYSTVDVLADDLRRHLASEPVSARPDSFAYRARSLLRRYRLQAATAAVVATALMTATIVSLEQARRAEAQRTAAFAAREDALRSRQYAEEQARLEQNRRDEAEQARDRERVAAEIARTEGERARQAALAERRAAQVAAAEARRATEMSEIARREQDKATDLNNFTLNVLGRMAADPNAKAQQQHMADAIRAQLEVAEQDLGANPASLASIYGAMASVFNYLQQENAQMQSALKELEYLERSSASPAELAESHRQLALAYMRNGDINASIDHAERGLSLLKEPLTDAERVTRMRLYRALGRYRYNQGNVQRAVAASAAAVAEYDRIPRTVQAAAANHFGSAVADHVTNLGVQARDDEAAGWLRRIDALYGGRSGISEADRADIEMARGRYFMEAGRAALAADAFRAAGQLYIPQFGSNGRNAAVVDGLLVGALAADGRFSEAQPLLARWERANVRPMLLEAVQVSLAHEDLALADRALSQLEGRPSFAASAPRHAVLQMLHRAEWLVALGRAREASELLARADADAVRLLPGAVRWQWQIAFARVNALLELGNTEAARASHKQACPGDLPPGSVEHRRCADVGARIALATGDALRAIQRLGTVPADRPFAEALWAQLVLGKRLLALNRAGEALAPLSAAVALAMRLHAESPTRASAHAAKGMALLALDRREEAREQLALAAQPHVPAADPATRIGREIAQLRSALDRP